MIKPDEIRQAAWKDLDKDVETAVDKLLVKHWDGYEAKFTQEEVLQAVCLAKNFSRERVYREKLLDFEEAYRAAGWSVFYDKPGYNESYEATFQFKKRTR